MTRILSYNILIGGIRRLDRLTNIIGSTESDIVGLVEATSATVVEEIANRLGMHFRVSGRGAHERDWQLAVLSRYPIVHTQVHERSIFTRKYLLEVTVEGPHGEHITVFVTHLTADFHKGRESNRVRQQEVQEILNIMSVKRGTPHVVMGDFNSLAPGDTMKASRLLNYMIREQSYYYRKDTNISRRLLRSALRTTLHTPLLSAMLDSVSPRYAQGGIDLLKKAGYIDCFRQVHPHALGYTCPAASPAGRIDFIFASPELAHSLSDCDIVTGGNGVRAEQASDHLPVLAEFAE